MLLNNHQLANQCDELAQTKFYAIARRRISSAACSFFVDAPE